MNGPLSGVRVVEFLAMGPVPFAGMLLADMGAEVVTIVPPDGATHKMPIPTEADPMMRGRSFLSLNLKAPVDLDRARALINAADMVMEGYRPGVMERLGLGPDTCLAENPTLAYGRMTGWGQNGPLAQVPGHDPNYLSLIGALDCIGYADRPPVPPLNLVGDFGGGGAFLVIGLLAAMTQARSTGVGRVVDAAMIDGAGALMTSIYSMLGRGMWSVGRGRNLLDGGVPFGRTYETADGKHVAVCSIEPPFYDALLRGLNMSQDDTPSRATRENLPALEALFSKKFKEKTRDEWAHVFADIPACVTPVLTIEEAPDHPHNVARGAFIERAGVRVPRAAPRFSGTPTDAAPQDGPAIEEVLTRWGVA